MAFRITYQGALIEADTAQDVQYLLLVFASPVLPRLLAAGAPPIAAADAPRSRKSRLGGGVAKTARGKVRGAAVPVPAAARVARAAGGGSVVDAVEQAVRAGIAKPGDINRHVGAQAIVVRRALKALLHSGRVIAEGKTMSRRYLPAGRRAAKEGV